METRSSQFTRGIPTPVSGYRENLQRTDRTRPLIGRSAADKAGLTVFEETPVAQVVVGKSAYVRPGTALSVHYLNVPRVDTYYWRSVARTVQAYVRKFNIESPGRSFFAAYPELRLDDDPDYALDDNRQIEALVHALRVYTEEVTYLVAAMSNNRIFSTVGSDSPYARYSSPLRWSKFNGDHRFANGFPIPKVLLNYITENTRPLQDTDINGAPVASFPQWRIDDAGYTSQMHQPLRSANPVENAANRVTLAQVTANLNSKGARPNSGPAVETGDVYEALGSLSLYPDVSVAAMGSDGYIPKLVNNTSRRILEELRVSTIFANFKNATHPLNTFFTKILPILDGSIDIESLDRAIRDNLPGSISEFASGSMVYGLGMGPTLSHTSRALTTFSLDAYKGVYLSSNDEYAALLRSTKTVGEVTYPLTQRYEPYYAVSLAVVDGDEAIPDPVFIGDIFPSDFSTDEGDSFDLMRLGNASRRVDAILGTPGVYPPKSASFTGLTASDLTQLLAAGVSADKPFIIREEMEAGITVIRSMITPLIDRWDPTQCGFYIIDPVDGAFISHWKDFFSALVASFTDRGLDRTKASFGYKHADTAMDVITFVGDGLLLGPDVMQARQGVGIAYTANAKADLTAIESLFPLWNSYGDPLVKPYTLDPPMNIKPWDTDDEDDEYPHLMPLDTTPVTGESFGWESATSYFFTAPIYWVWFWKDLMASVLPVVFRKKALPYSYLPTCRAVNLAETYMATGEAVSRDTVTFPSVPQATYGSGDLEVEEQGKAIALAKPKFISGSKFGDRSRSRVPRSDWKATKGKRKSGGVKSVKPPITSTELLGVSSETSTDGKEKLLTPSEDSPFKK